MRDKLPQVEVDIYDYEPWPVTSKKRRLGRTLVSLALVASLPSAMSKAFLNDATYFYRVAGSVFTESCPNVTGNEMSQVRETIVDTEQYAEHLVYSSQKDYLEGIKIEAAALELTLPNTNGYIQRLEDAQTKYEIIFEMNEYLKEVGVTLHFDELPFRRTKFGPQFIETKVSETEPEELRAIAYNLADTFHSLPREIIDLGNLEDIYIVDQIDDNYAGKTIMGESWVVISRSEAQKSMSYIVDHELGHLVSATHCGEVRAGLGRDSQYTSLNPIGFRYSGSDWQNQASANSLEVVKRAYGSLDVGEDIATSYEDVLDGLNPSLVNNPYSMRVVDQKNILLNARIVQDIPNYVRYATILAKARIAEGA